MAKDKPITHDLFEVDECYFCNGEGQVEVDNKTNPNEERIEDCNMCNGTGIDV